MSTIGHNGGPSIAPDDQREKASNWFAVSREIFDHPIVGIHDRAFTDTEAWLYLLSLAAYAPTEVENKGATLVLDPGQIMAAYAFLATRWRWSADKVRWYLKRLQNEAMISRYTTSARAEDQASDTEVGNTKQDTNPNTKHHTKRRTNQIQILTICNYAFYQYVHTQQNQAQHQAAHQPPHQASHQESNNTNTSLHLDSENPITVCAPSASAEKVRETAPCEHRVDHGVLVNGKTIRHESGAFLISLPAVHAGVAKAKLDEDAINAKCLSRALQWGAALEAGQSSDLALPANVVETLSREILQEVELAKAEAKAERAAKRGTRLPADWRLPKSWGEWALRRFEVAPDQIRLEAERFKDYWLSASKNATKANWERTWRVWCSSDKRAWRTRRGYVPDASDAIDRPSDLVRDSDPAAYNAAYSASWAEARSMLYGDDDDAR